jgi:hypothetical protein
MKQIDEKGDKKKTVTPVQQFRPGILTIVEQVWNAGLGPAVSVLRHENSLILSRSELQVVLHGVDVALGVLNLRVHFYPVTVLKFHQF